MAEIDTGMKYESKRPLTVRRLLNDPRFRMNGSGSLTDEAFAAYKLTSEAHKDGFIPDDELDTTYVIGLHLIGPDPGNVIKD